MKETHPDGNTRFVHELLFSLYIVSILSSKTVMGAGKVISQGGFVFM